MIGSPSVSQREQGGQHRGHGEDEEDASDAGVVERGDEAGGGRGHAQSDRDAREADRPERLHHSAALDDSDVREQRGAREDGSAEDLGRRVQRELALKDAGGRPCDCGECDVDLPAALAP